MQKKFAFLLLIFFPSIFSMDLSLTEFVDKADLSFDVSANLLKTYINKDMIQEFKEPEVFPLDKKQSYLPKQLSPEQQKIFSDLRALCPHSLFVSNKNSHLFLKKICGNLVKKDIISVEKDIISHDIPFHFLGLDKDTQDCYFNNNIIKISLIETPLIRNDERDENFFSLPASKKVEQNKQKPEIPPFNLERLKGIYPISFLVLQEEKRQLTIYRQ